MFALDPLDVPHDALVLESEGGGGVQEHPGVGQDLRGFHLGMVVGDLLYLLPEG